MAENPFSTEIFFLPGLSRFIEKGKDSQEISGDIGFAVPSDEGKTEAVILDGLADQIGNRDRNLSWNSYILST